MYEISELTGNIYFNGVLVPQDDTNPMWQAYWQHKQNGGEIVFVEATDEEIAEANKPIVPYSISRMRLKLELFERNITVEDIVDTITSIPSAVFSESEKQKALIKFQEATSYDRYNADLNLIATLMGLSQQDLDEIFINGNIF